MLSRVQDIYLSDSNLSEKVDKISTSLSELRILYLDSKKMYIS